MAFCQVCGAQMPEGIKFCPACGAAAYAQATAADPNAQYRQAQADPGAYQDQQQQQQQYQQRQQPQQRPVPPCKEAGAYRVLTVLAYLCFPLLFILLILEPRSNYIRAHANQVIALNIWFVACAIVAIIPFLGWLASAVGGIAGIVFLINAMVRANRYEIYQIPVTGKWNIVPQDPEA